MSFSCCFTWMQGGNDYTSWSRYRAFYSTPDADRDYLQYLETIVKELRVCPVQWSVSSNLELCSVFLFFGLTMFVLDSGLNSICWQTSRLLRYAYLTSQNHEIEVCIYESSINVAAVQHHNNLSVLLLSGRVYIQRLHSKHVGSQLGFRTWLWN